MVLPKLYSKITCVMRETNLSSDSDSACACLNEQKKSSTTTIEFIFITIQIPPKGYFILGLLVYSFNSYRFIIPPFPIFICIQVFLSFSITLIIIYTIFYFFFIISQLCRVQVIVNKFSQLV